MSIKENKEKKKQVSLYLFFFIRHTCVCRSLTSFQTLNNKGGGEDSTKKEESLCVCTAVERGEREC